MEVQINDRNKYGNFNPIQESFSVQELRRITFNWEETFRSMSPGLQARLIRGAGEDPVLQLRVKNGLLQFEVNGRPDGSIYGDTRKTVVEHLLRDRKDRNIISVEEAYALRREMEQVRNRLKAFLAIGCDVGVARDSDYLLRGWQVLYPHLEDQEEYFVEMSEILDLIRLRADSGIIITHEVQDFRAAVDHIDRLIKDTKFWCGQFQQKADTHLYQQSQQMLEYLEMRMDAQISEESFNTSEFAPQGSKRNYTLLSRVPSYECDLAQDKLISFMQPFGASFDLSCLTKNWPFIPQKIVAAREIQGLGGESFIQVRVDSGLLEFRRNGNPDDKARQDTVSWLDFYKTEQNAHDLNLGETGDTNFTLDELAIHRLEGERQLLLWRAEALSELEQFLECLRDLDHSLLIVKLVEEHGDPQHFQEIFLRETIKLLVLRSSNIVMGAMRLRDYDLAFESLNSGIEHIKYYGRKYGKGNASIGEVVHTALVELLDVLGAVIKVLPKDHPRYLEEKLRKAIEAEDYRMAREVHNQLLTVLEKNMPTS